MRRRVFFIHGFDPRGPAPYHALCVEAAQVASSRAKSGVTVTPRKSVSALSSVWTLSAGPVEVDYEFLRYDDIVRRLSARWSGLARYVIGWRVLLALWRCGLARLLFLDAPRTFIAVHLQALASAAILLLAIVGLGAVWLTGQWLVQAFGAPGWLCLPAIAILLLVLFLLRHRIEARSGMRWYTQCLAYVTDSAAGAIESPAVRCAAFAQRIAESWRQSDCEEIVVVGHSVGTLLAVRALAKVLELEPHICESGPPLILMTLGQSIPFYTHLRRDPGFDDDLERVAANFGWMDLTSKLDAASTGRVPILTASAAPERIVSLPTPCVDAHAPKLLSRSALRPLEFHFRYLQPTEANEGDYFQLIAESAKPLARSPRPSQAGHDAAPESRPSTDGFGLLSPPSAIVGRRSA
jgi:hypothetical protein